MDTGRQNTGVFSAAVRSRGRTGHTMAHSPSFVGWWDGHTRGGGNCTDYGGLRYGPVAWTSGTSQAEIIHAEQIFPAS